MSGTVVHLTSTSEPVVQAGINLSLLKLQTIAQTLIGGTIVTSVIVAVVVGVSVFATTVGYDYPIVSPDHTTTYKVTPVRIFVLLNDKDPRNANLTIVAVTNPQHGKVKIVDGSYLLYTPQKYFAGIDTFNYTAQNDKLQSMAQVTVEVVNRLPEVIPQKYQISKNSKANKADIFNYRNEAGLKVSDIDGDMLYVSSATQPTFGTTVFDEANVYYTPNANFNGVDTCNYTVYDGNGTATQILTFIVSNNAPVAKPDYVTIPKNTWYAIDVLANDYDVNKDTLTVAWCGNAGHGSCTVSVDGKFATYTPEWTPSSTTDSFEYTISDGSLTASSFALLTIENKPPVAQDTDVEICMNGQTFTPVSNFSNLYYDTDAAEYLSVRIINDVSHGQIEFRPVGAVTTGTSFANGIKYILYPEKVAKSYYLAYKPTSGYQGLDSLKYEVTDSGKLTAIGTIRFNIGNRPPVPVNRSWSVNRRATYSADVLTGATDPNGDEVVFDSVVAIPGVTKGTISKINSTHAKYVAPSEASIFSDYFQFVVKDVRPNPTEIMSGTGTVAVIICNQAPIAIDDTVTVPKGLTTIINILANDSDPNQDTIIINTVNVPTKGGSVQIINNRTLLSFTAVNSITTDTFKYNIKDDVVDSLVSGFATVVVNVANTAPIANSDSYNVFWNSTGNSFDVLANDDDINPNDKSILTVESVGTPSQGGSVSIVNNRVIYAPRAGFVGTETFTYVAKDETLASNTATVTVTVANNVPIAGNDDATKHHATSNILVDVLANDSDPQNDPLAIVSTNNNRAQIVTASGKQQIQYASVAGFTGTDSFTYTISDYEKTATATVTVTVTDTAPVTANDAVTVHWSNAAQQTVAVLDNDSDNEKDTLTLVSIATPQHFRGSASVSGNNVVFSGTGSGYKGVQNIGYTVTDGALTSTGTLVATVTNNDVPVAPAKSVTTHWRTQSTGTTVSLVATAADADGDTNTVTFTQPAGQTGIVTAFGATAVLYKRLNWKGTDVFSYTVSDGLDSATGQVTVTVTNAVPIVPNFQVTVPGNALATGLDIDAVARASDVDGADAAQLTLTAATGTANGQVSIVAGKVRYTPNTAYVTAGGGTDTVSYTVSDGLDSATGTISVFVPSVSASDVVRSFNLLWTTQGAGSNLDLTAGTIINQTPSPPPTNGQFSINTGANRFFYKQTAGYLGSDYAEVFVNDGTTVIKVKVFITIYNTLPTANSLSVSTHWRALLSGVNYNVLAGAADADADTVSLSSASGATRGTTSLPGSGNVRYTAFAPFLGPTADTFNFVASDGIQSVTRSVTITPTNANKPTAPSKTATAHWRIGTVTIPILAGATDADGDTLTLTATTPAGATVTVSGNALVYTKANFVGQDSFTYTISDGIESASGTVTITFTNTAPVANPDTTAVYWRSATAINISPLSNDVDANSDPLSIASATISSGAGMITATTASVVSFKPAGSSLTPAVITYTITDGKATARSTITVSMSNNAPIANQVMATTKRTSSVQLQTTCTDADADPLMYGPTQLTSTKGTATWGGNGVVTYTPGSPTLTCTNGVCSATDTFSYTCSDGVSSGSNSFVVTITNSVPVANPDFYSLTRNRNANPTLTLNVLANDTDADGDPLSISAFNANNGAVVSRSADMKTLRYISNVGFAGIDTVSYTVTDGSASTTAIATISVINTAPSCQNITVTSMKGKSIKINPLTAGACFDANNDPLTFSISGTPLKGIARTSSDDGISFVTYTPSSSRACTDNFTYTVSDGFTTVTRTITVIMTKRAIVTPATKYFSCTTFASSRSYSLALLADISDDHDDDDSLSVTSIDDSENCLKNATVAGSLQMSGKNVRYEIKGGWSGECEFTYKIHDNDDDNKLARKVVVTCTNYDPVAVADYYTTNQNTVFTVATSSLIVNDYDLNNDTISFDTIMCGQSGFACQKTPTISGSIITIPADSTCGKVQFYYRIRTADGKTGIGSFFVKYTNCRCSSPADVIFVLDGSGSISDANWGVAKDFVNEIVDKLDVGTSKVWVGLVQFSDLSSFDGAYGFGFISTDAAAVKNSVNSRSQYKSWTGTISGLDKAMELATISTRTNVAKTFIVITDGAPNQPCSCDTCQNYYGHQSSCTRNSWPGMTCSDCSWDTSNWCMPCADPRDRAAQINARINPKHKIVTIGIGGDLSPFGESITKDMAFDTSAYFRVGWDTATSVVSKVIDESCN